MLERTLNIKLLDEIQDSFNQQNVELILSHFTDDCEWLMARGPSEPEGRRCHGKLEIGDVLRVIRMPYFGQIGRVSGLPAELQAVESGAVVRVLEVELDGGERVVVPRANVELIEE